MDNISGNANYTSDQDLVKGKKKTVKKKLVKEKEKPIKITDDIVTDTPGLIYQKAVELHRLIEDEYNETNRKKLYDALISAQGVIEVMRDFE